MSAKVAEGIADGPETLWHRPASWLMTERSARGREPDGPLQATAGAEGLDVLSPPSRLRGQPRT